MEIYEVSLEESKTKIKEKLLGDSALLKNIVRELNCCGCLEDLEYFYNDEEFFRTFFHNQTMEAVRAVTYGDYRYTDAYVVFNAYGNLESFNEWELIEELKDNIDDIVSELIENKNHVYTTDEELKELLEVE